MGLLLATYWSHTAKSLQVFRAQGRCEIRLCSASLGSTLCELGAKLRLFWGFPIGSNDK